MKLPYKDNVTFKEGEIPKPRYKIWMANNYTRVILWDEVIVKFKGDMSRLTIQVPGDYYDKVSHPNTSFIAGKVDPLGVFVFLMTVGKETPFPTPQAHSVPCPPRSAAYVETIMGR